MENEILQKISSEYTKEKKKIDELKLTKARLKELKQDKLVREYIKLSNKLANNNDKKQLNEQDMIYRIFLKYKSSIKKSNNIYVYMGTYQYSHETDVEHGPTDYRVSRNDINADYSVYMNLETEDSEEISISDRNYFEQTHKIIIPKCLSEQKEFYDMQRAFIRDCINIGQSVAVQKILGRKK